MAVSNLDFSAKIDAWTQATKERTLAVFHGATQELVSKAQARIPVDTGFARASIRGSLEAMPPIDPAAKKPSTGKNSVPYDSSEIVLTIANAQLGQTVFIGWTANYVQYLEWGHSQQAPSGFVGITAMEWPQIVTNEIVKAKASVASRA